MINRRPDLSGHIIMGLCMIWTGKCARRSIKCSTRKRCPLQRHGIDTSKVFFGDTKRFRFRRSAPPINTDSIDTCLDSVEFSKEVHVCLANLVVTDILKEVVAARNLKRNEQEE